AGVAGGWVAESGAAWLWRPEAEVVGFRSRPELGELVAWCVAGGRRGVRLVTEEGGSGKTRLALQLETELAGHGWRTLWVEGGGRARRSLRCAIAESPRCWWSIMPRPGGAWRGCWQRRRLPGGARMCAWCCWRAVPSVSDISDRLALPPPPTAPWPECVRFFLTLSQALARPDAFLPDLATALNNQSERLADLGRREEALAAIEEAATTYRALAQARPAVFAGRYASSLVGWKPRPRSCRSLAATAKRKRSSRKLPPSAEIAELHEQFTAHNATTRPADTSSKHTLVPQTRSRLVTASVATSLRLAFGLSNRREEG